MLGFFSSFVTYFNSFFLVLLLIAVISTISFWWKLAKRHRTTIAVLKKDWAPIIVGVIIQCFCGLLLEKGISANPHIALIIPLLNGVGGDISGIYSSRAASALHSKKGRIESEKLTSFSLMFITTPLQIFLLIIATFANLIRGQGIVPFWLGVVYLIVAWFQVCCLLPLGEWLAVRSFIHNLDPDNNVAPYLTALGDLIGTGFLAILVHFLGL